jgi:Kef-type K+ transport system membrane component KefB
MSLLSQTAIFLAAAVLAVSLFRSLKLGAVLGYLAAGVIIGPSALGLITKVDNVLHFAELGVVLLLFVIGLELQPSRLWVLRKSVFGLGGAQVLATALVLGAIGYGFGLTWQSATVTGLALAMSSTAFVLQILAERRQLTTRSGRSAFAILCFRTSRSSRSCAHPLLAIGPRGGAASPWLAALARRSDRGRVFGGRLVLKRVFAVIARANIEEIFTAAALLVVIRCRC